MIDLIILRPVTLSSPSLQAICITVSAFSTHSKYGVFCNVGCLGRGRLVPFWLEARLMFEKELIRRVKEIR